MKKKSPRKKLKDKLEKVVKEIVKIRDNRTCQMCGKKDLTGANCHVSHVIPRSQSLLLMFDTLNLKQLCFHCHINLWHKNPIDSAKWFLDKFPERWAYLIEKRKVRKPVKDFELLEMLEKRKEELKTLQDD